MTETNAQWFFSNEKENNKKERKNGTDHFRAVDSGIEKHIVCIENDQNKISFVQVVAFNEKSGPSYILLIIHGNIKMIFINLCSLLNWWCRSVIYNDLMCIGAFPGMTNRLYVNNRVKWHVIYNNLLNL